MNKYRCVKRTKKRGYRYEFVYKGMVYKEDGFSSALEAFICAEKLRGYIQNQEYGFKDYVILYLEKYRKERWRLATSVNSSYTIMKYIYPAFDNVPIYTLTQKDFDDWREKIKSCHLKKQNTILYYMKDLFTFLKNFYSIDCPYPFRLLPIRKEYSEEEDEDEDVAEKRAISFDTIMKLLSVIDEKEFYVLFSVHFFTGMRPGEVRGLKWKDIDFEKRVIKVKRAVTSKVKLGHSISDGLKTEKSKRRFAIPDFLNKEFEIWKNMTPFPGDNDYVFHSLKPLTGFYPVSANTVKRRLDKYCEMIGIKQLDPHECRHSISTDLYESGKVSIDEISRLLGHSSTQTTERVYIHSVESKRRKIADLLDEIYERSLGKI